MPDVSRELGHLGRLGTAGTPVADLTRTTYDPTGRPVEVMPAMLTADMSTSACRFPISDQDTCAHHL
jgi:hypothetical protein